MQDSNGFMPGIEQVALITIVIIVALGAIKSVFRKFRPHTVRGGSVLLAYYIGDADVQQLASGKIGGMHYTAMAILGGISGQDSPGKTALVYRVELPFASRIHLLSVPKRSGAVQLNPALGNSIMEQVDLEGNYYEYFSLYCQKGMQAETRYVLDPKAMVFMIDFCQSHNWEIVDNELYFLQESGTGSSDDKTAMFGDIEKFVAEIRPALERPLSAADIARITPYGQDRREHLPCPLCGAAMPNTDNRFQCPAGHGILLSGKALASMMSGRRIEAKEDAVPRDHDLRCPGCGHTMNRVGYNGSAMIVDSCTKCTYRWLDESEIAG